MTPALADLQLTTVGSDSVEVEWNGGTSHLRGYWLTWEGQQSSAPGQRSSLYLPPDSLSTRLTHLPPSARVCVSPIYRTARGEGLCCTAQFHSGECGPGRLKSTKELNFFKVSWLIYYGLVWSFSTKHWGQKKIKKLYKAKTHALFWYSIKPCI